MHRHNDNEISNTLHNESNASNRHCRVCVCVSVLFCHHCRHIICDALSLSSSLRMCVALLLIPSVILCVLFSRRSRVYHPLILISHHASPSHSFLSHVCMLALVVICIRSLSLSPTHTLSSSYHEYVVISSSYVVIVVYLCLHVVTYTMTMSETHTHTPDDHDKNGDESNTHTITWMATRWR